MLNECTSTQVPKLEISVQINKNMLGTAFNSYSTLKIIAPAVNDTQSEFDSFNKLCWIGVCLPFVSAISINAPSGNLCSDRSMQSCQLCAIGTLPSHMRFASKESLQHAPHLTILVWDEPQMFFGRITIKTLVGHLCKKGENQ